MTDINLIGHLTIDRIYENDFSYTSLGGIANVWEGLIKLDDSLIVDLCPLYIGKALIYADVKTCQRYSKAVLNSKKLDFPPGSAKINHIAYINFLSDFDFLKDIKGLISADICTGKRVDLDILKFIDILFIADEDSDNLDEIIEYTKGLVVLHHPNGSTIYHKTNKKVEYVLRNDLKIENLNVLGAGDLFASAFLNCVLKNGLNNISKHLENIHHDTYLLLKEHQ